TSGASLEIPHVAESVIGRAFARPVGSCGLQAAALILRSGVFAASRRMATCATHGSRREDALLTMRQHMLLAATNSRPWRRRQEMDVVFRGHRHHVLGLLFLHVVKA